MPTAKTYEQSGSEKGTIDLPEHLFSCEINEAAIHQAVVAYMANQRQGTVKTKERSDVSGGGKKPFRQKGTGRARAGTNRSPIYRGGGVVFGPRPRDYRQSLPKKIKRLALRSSLSSRAKEGAVGIVEDLHFSEPKTKQFVDFLTKVGSYRDKVLLVLDKPNDTVYKSARNVPGVKVTLANALNTYDVLWADTILLTASALSRAEEVFKS